MSKVMSYQTAFNRGELDPALFGRADWQPYFSGAKKIRNMICRPQGGAMKRAGTRLVVQALDQTKPSVLIRFQFSVSQVYLLEFSDYRFRVLMDGGVVTYPEGYELNGEDVGGQEVIVATPYSAEQMQRVRVTQMEDIMIMTHPDFRPRTLTRKDHHIWEMDYLTFGVDIEPPVALSLTKDGNNGIKYKVAAIADNNEESFPSEHVECKTATGVGFPVPIYEQLNAQQCYTLWVSLYGQAWPAAYRWDNVDCWAIYGGYGKTGVVQYLQSRFGYGPSSEKKEIVTMYHKNGTRIKCDKDDWRGWESTLAQAVATVWPKGHSALLDDMRARIQKFVEDYNSNATASGHSTLEWEPVEKAVRYRIYRSTKVEDQEVFYYVGETAATTFADDNLPFAASETPQVSTDLFSNENGYPGVCAFHEQRLYLGRTNNQPNTFWGSRVGAWRNFNRNEIGEDEEGNPIGKVSDTSSFEFTIYAKEVNEIFWLEPMSDILAGTGGGEYTISGGNYIITATNVSAVRQSRYGCANIEPVVVGQAVIGVGANHRMLRAFKWDYAGDAYAGVDISHFAGHLFRKRNISQIAYQRPPESIIWTIMSDGALLSCTYLSEEQVLSWSRHDTEGRFEAVVNMIGLDGEDDIYFEVAREINGETVRFIEQLQSPLEDGDDVLDGWYLDCAAEYRGEETDRLSGLGYLEGKKVACFADGNVFTDIIVRDGIITLPGPVSRAVIGLPYRAELETMELEMLGGGYIFNLNRRSVMASILFYNTRECFYGSQANPSEMKFGPGDPLIPKTIRKTVTVPMSPESIGGGLLLWSDSPVPFGVLSMAVELSVGSMSPGSGKALGA